MALYAFEGRAPRIDPSVYVDPTAIVIGDVEIGPEASVWPNAVLRGDDGAIRIGARSNIQDGAVVHCTPAHDTIVGEGCTIGHLAHLEGCTIADNSLVGTASVVLHDARVGPHALVGANAVVTNGQVVPERAMALGVPAKVRPDAVDPDANRFNAEVYVERGRRYRHGLRRLD